MEILSLAQVQDRLKTAAQVVFRGYSDPTLVERRRLADGNITPEDRKRFLQNKETAARFAITMLTGLRTPGEPPDYSQALLPTDHRRFFEVSDELNSLSEEELAQRIQQDARQDLKRWGQAI